MKRFITNSILVLYLTSCQSDSSVVSDTSATTKTVDTVSTIMPDTGRGFKTGDVVFQTTGGRLMVPLQEATGNDYTHCGVIILEENGNVVVVEAFDSVMKTPVEKWIDRGVGKRYTVKRLTKQGGLNPLEEERMRDGISSLLGLPYDQQYMWSNDRIYCSELVYKAYQAAGIELCKLRPMKSYNLNSPQVKKAMKLIYQGKIPYNEKMVAPGDVYGSKLLKEVTVK